MDFKEFKQKEDELIEKAAKLSEQITIKLMSLKDGEKADELIMNEIANASNDKDLMQFLAYNSMLNAIKMILS